VNVVDSSAWLEYFADGPNAVHFAPVLERPSSVLVPVICLAEVYRRMDAQRGEQDALTAVAAMRQGTVIDIDLALAMLAAKLRRMHRLPLADSYVYAVAVAHRATVWTQDADFEGLKGVRYFSKD
jgi:predicted nucleic acid-binding protein